MPPPFADGNTQNNPPSTLHAHLPLSFLSYLLTTNVQHQTPAQTDDNPPRVVEAATVCNSSLCLSQDTLAAKYFCLKGYFRQGCHSHMFNSICLMVIMCGALLQTGSQAVHVQCWCVSGCAGHLWVPKPKRPPTILPYWFVSHFRFSLH